MAITVTAKDDTDLTCRGYAIMSDSAEGLEFFKPDFSRRVVPTPIDYETESRAGSKFPSVGQASPRSDGVDIRTRHSRASKNSRRNDLPNVRTDTDNQPSLLDRVTKFLPGWMVSFLLHTLLLSILAAYVSVPQTQQGPLSLVVSMTQAEAEEDDVFVESTANFEMALDAALAVEEVELDEPVEIDLGELLDSSIVNFNDASTASSITDRGDDFAAVDVGESGQSNTGIPSPGGKEGTSFFGIESKGDRFVYVVDCSGSMSEEDRYQRAIYELHRSLGKLNEDQEFLVAIYNDRIFPMLGTSLTEAKLIKATVENRAKVIQWMRTQVPSGFTLPARAMYGALQVQPDAIFLLSDGELGDDTVGMLQNTNLGSKSAGAPKIPINTITLGSTGAGLPTMQTIAEENEGEFIWVK